MQLIRSVIASLRGSRSYSQRNRQLSLNLELPKKSHSTKGTNMAELTEIKSPCIGNCYQNTSVGLCMGCYRTEWEKKDWKDMNPGDKMDTRVLCALRKDKHGNIETQKHGERYYSAPIGR